MKVQDYRSGNHPVQTGRLRLSVASDNTLRIGIVISIFDRGTREDFYSLYTLREYSVVQYDIQKSDWY